MRTTAYPFGGVNNGSHTDDSWTGHPTRHFFFFFFMDRNFLVVFNTRVSCIIITIISFTFYGANKRVFFFIYTYIILSRSVTHRQFIILRVLLLLLVYTYINKTLLWQTRVRFNPITYRSHSCARIGPRRRARGGGVFFKKKKPKIGLKTATILVPRPSASPNTIF